MTVGTKSILFGAHCFFLHPFFVVAAWWKLNGFPWDPRLWVAFFVHDLGYIGKPNMDGPEGEKHVEFGAAIMSRLFDSENNLWQDHVAVENPDGTFWWCGPWGQLSLFHSRFYAKKFGKKPSKLCMADKLAIAMTPAWLYLPMVRATGEIKEYMALAQKRNLAIDDPTAQNKHASMNLGTSDEKQWYADVQQYVRRWVEEHRDGREDGWTPKQ